MASLYEKCSKSLSVVALVVSNSLSANSFLPGILHPKACLIEELTGLTGLDLVEGGLWHCPKARNVHLCARLTFEGLRAEKGTSTSTTLGSLALPSPESCEIESR